MLGVPHLKVVLEDQEEPRAVQLEVHQQMEWEEAMEPEQVAEYRLLKTILVELEPLELYGPELLELRAHSLQQIQVISNHAMLY